MSRKNIIVVWCFAVTVFVTVLASAGQTQMADSTKQNGTPDWLKSKQAFQAYAEKIGKPDSADAWLILDGILLQPPFDVRAKDSTITINGINICPELVQQTNVEVDSTTMAIHRAVQDASANFRMWCADHGLEEARNRVFDFMKSQPIVERIYWQSDAHLRFLFRGEKYEDGMLLNPPDEPPLPPEEMLRAQLDGRVKAIRGALARGNLVIIQNGIFSITLHPRSKMIIDRLMEIANSTGDIEERTTAIKEIISDVTIARRIAERLQLK